MVVIGEDNFHSVSCNRCGYGTSGKNPLPDSYINKLIEEGYIRQLAKNLAGVEELTLFFATRIRHRSPAELAGDLLEHYEVSPR